MTLMDTAQLLGSLGDFAGAILIAVTLIYLSVQVRQNTRALQTQSRQAALSCSLAELLAAVEHRDIHLAIMRGVNGLSPEENIKVYFWRTTVRAREFAWLQFRDGIIDEVQLRQESLVIQAVLGRGVSRLWWESVGRPIFPAEFAAFVDDLLRDDAGVDASMLASWANQLVSD
jgi:hypothetical protein